MRTSRQDEEGAAGVWARVLWLDRAVRDRRYPNAAAIQEEFATSRRTAFNTLDFLRWSLGAPLTYDRKRRGYCYEDPTYALPAMFLQEGELLALLLADDLARQYLGTPLEAPLRSAIDKLHRYLPDGVAVELQSLSDCFRLVGGPGLDVPVVLMLAVKRAARERRVLRIRYYTASRDDTREREIEPHFLLNVSGDWMIVAWDRWRDADRVFMLTRILEHTVLEERFRPRPQLDPQSYDRHTFRTEHGAVEPCRVQLQFDAYQARWIRERRWHHSQDIEELGDGRLILTMVVSGESDLLRWVLGYGSHVEVLAPPALRARVTAELEAAAGVYRRG